MASNEPRSDVGRFLAELRRRRVGRFTIGYAAAAFVVLQLAEIVFPAFNIGEGGLRVLVVAVVLGFLPAVVLAWIYDVTSEGIRRTEEEEAPAGPGRRRSPLVAFAITTILVSGAAGWYIVDSGMLASSERRSPEPTLAYNPSEPIRSLVVLPLQDFSPGGDQGYFAAGMHDEIIAELSMIQGVRVVSRTTSMNYANTALSIPQIGRELGVDVVVEGSVNRSGDEVRINLQVIDAASDASIETLQIDGSTDDLLDVQQDAAERVATVIGSTYGRTDIGRENLPPAAQDAYYRARYEMERRTADGYERAIGWFDEALAAAPEFAEALAGRAAARFRLELWTGERRPEMLERARRESEDALALDSTSAQVREVRDNILAALEQIRAASTEAGTAESPTGQAVASRARPTAVRDSALAGIFERLWSMSRTEFGRQIEEAMRAGELVGPEAVAQRIVEARFDMSLGQFPEAAERLESIVEASPESADGWEQLMRAYVAMGDLPAAVDAVERWADSGAPRAPERASLARLRSAVDREGARGYWAWRRDYLIAQQEAGGEIVLTDLAAAYAALGDPDRAFQLLEQAVERSESRLLALARDPVWDPIRRDVRYRPLVERVEQLRLEVIANIDSGRRAPTGGEGGP